MTDKTLRDRVRRYYDELWNQWQLDLIDELITRDVRFRGSLGVEVRGRSAFRNYVLLVQRAFPDFHNAIEELIAGDGKVVARLSYSGTHSGEIFGIPRSGHKVAYSGVGIFGFDGQNRIDSAWILGDTMTLLRQLGAKTLPS
jgi:steroid delta-isomerase-like uncharacterized protein